MGGRWRRCLFLLGLAAGFVRWPNGGPRRRVVSLAEKLSSAGRNGSEGFSRYLVTEGFSPEDIALMQKKMKGHKQSSEEEVIPNIKYLLRLGLNTKQVAKGVATFPSMLWLSIESIKPSVDWLVNFGLNKMQVATIIATHPRILVRNTEQDFRPTVDWLLDLGLNEMQLAKVLTRFPQILGLSIEQNLQPKVAWLLDLGLRKRQVAQAVVAHPPLLAYSMEKNLQPKCSLLRSYFSREELVTLLTSFPPVVGYSYSRLSERAGVLAAQKKLKKLPCALTLDAEKFFDRYGAMVTSAMGSLK